ncbi:MAG: DUF3105 domain-containing protein [Proteobacteria bacterium]|nr:DUF3105 domain-containing protein [Pseudomonadota bacterium]
MPKSKTKRRKQSSKPAKTNTGEGSVQWGGSSSGNLGSFTKSFLYLILIAVVGGVAWFWWSGTTVNREFAALAEAGKPALEKVVTLPNLGRRHLDIGEGYRYADPFPTSGPHSQTWVQPGEYNDRQLPTMLVHALEHGNIVVYYDQPGNEALEKLRSWTGTYRGQWDGMVLTPNRGLGKRVVLTAWTKRLELPEFDPAAAAAFIDAYRGRGPENPVR